MDRIWTFKTARLEVFCECEEEREPDLSWADEDMLHKLDMGLYVNLTWRVGVEINGELYADEYLGNSVYENPREFLRHHRDAAGAGDADVGSYFVDMVRSSLKETRRKLEREEEYSDRELRNAALNHRGEP